MIFLAFALVAIAQIGGGIYLLMHGHPVAGGFLVITGALYACCTELSRGSNTKGG